MNIFDKLIHYSDSWSVTDSRDFSQEEQDAVARAVVVNSTYGLSVCFCMLGGGKTFIPLSINSTLTAGDTVDVSKAKLLTLSREGDDDINRVEI